MEIKIGKDNGHIILDDNTGKIMTVLVKNIVEGKHDFLTTTSYSRKGDKHYNMREQNTKSQFNFKQDNWMETMVAPMDPQLEKDIMSGKLKFIVKNTPNDQELGAKIREWYWEKGQ